MSTLQVLLRRAGLDDEQDLEDRYGITVGKDGLIEPERITPKVARLIGDLPIALWHHTSSALEKKIRKHGLVIGKQTNLFNSQAGVYVSTIAGGRPVDLYSAMAVRKYGGEPIAIRVRRTLDQIQPDPDDADLAWAQGRQFITDPPVPPEDLTFDWVPWESNPSMRFLTDCTCAPGHAINAMKDRAREITRKTFLKYVDRDSLKEIEQALGYDRGFTMAGDWHVAYYKSVYRGQPVVYFTHSAIEHIFMHGA